MNRSFNISEWALGHRSFVWFLVIIIVAAGAMSYLRLGRNEDPNFTIKTMVVRVLWPGANITDTLQQVTDRVEKKLQETPGLDYIKSYTVAGTSTVFITLKGSVVSRDVPDVWYQAWWRTSRVGLLPIWLALRQGARSANAGSAIGSGSDNLQHWQEPLKSERHGEANSRSALSRFQPRPMSSNLSWRGCVTVYRRVYPVSWRACWNGPERDCSSSRTN